MTELYVFVVAADLAAPLSVSVDFATVCSDFAAPPVSRNIAVSHFIAVRTDCGIADISVTDALGTDVAALTVLRVLSVAEPTRDCGLLNACLDALWCKTVVYEYRTVP